MTASFYYLPRQPTFNPGAQHEYHHHQYRSPPVCRYRLPAGKFVQVTNEDLKGKWSVVFFYPADFTFVCPTELGDLADSYAEFKKLGVEIYAVSTDTISRTRPGTTPRRPSARSSTR